MCLQNKRMACYGIEAASQRVNPRSSTHTDVEIWNIGCFVWIYFQLFVSPYWCEKQNGKNHFQHHIYILMSSLMLQNAMLCYALYCYYCLADAMSFLSSLTFPYVYIGKFNPIWSLWISELNVGWRKKTGNRNNDEQGCIIQWLHL